ncbi:MAG: hypothetical protein IJ057_01165 [Bacteroidales bacterium]|nr:hypothetical protein [Bacteroidales bacterium]
MSDKMVDMVVKGIPPEELVKRLESEQQEIMKRKRWLEEHTITMDTNIGNSIQSEDAENDLYQFLQTLKSALEDLIDMYSAVVSKYAKLKDKVNETLSVLHNDE